MSANPLEGLDLSKKVGPLPLGVWVVGIGGAIGIVMYRRNSESMPATTEGDGETSGAPLYPGVGNGAVGGYVGNATPAPSAAEITDNTAWARAAINHLIGQGYEPTVSDSAIRKYLLSAKLSVSEYALVNVALLKFGPPPQALPQAPADAPVVTPPPPVSVPAPVAPPPPPPAPAPPVSNGFWYTINSPGDNLSRMAQRTYGRPDWQRIYNANRDRIRDPNLVYLGQTIWIPL